MLGGLGAARQQVASPVVVDTNRVLGNLEPILRRLLREDIELTIMRDEGLWPVKVDPSQLEQVVMNLMVNARDAMQDRGSITLTTRNVTRRDPTERLKVFVARQGSADRHSFDQVDHEAADLAVVVHCRDAWAACVEVLEQEGLGDGGGRVVLHCYSGDAATTEPEALISLTSAPSGSPMRSRSAGCTWAPAPIANFASDGDSAVPTARSYSLRLTTRR